MMPTATIHVTSMELVTGNGPILKDGRRLGRQPFRGRFGPGRGGRRARRVRSRLQQGGHQTRQHKQQNCNFNQSHYPNCKPVMENTAATGSAISTRPVRAGSCIIHEIFHKRFFDNL